MDTPRNAWRTTDGDPLYAIRLTSYVIRVTYVIRVAFLLDLHRRTAIKRRTPWPAPSVAGLVLSPGVTVEVVVMGMEDR